MIRSARLPDARRKTRIDLSLIDATNHYAVLRISILCDGSERIRRINVSQLRIQILLESHPILHRVLTLDPGHVVAEARNLLLILVRNAGRAAKGSDIRNHDLRAGPR